MRSLFPEALIRRAASIWNIVVAALAMMLCSMPALADSTSVSIGAATKGADYQPVDIQSPITRSGDLGYDTILNYHTVDGSAVSPTDYAASTGYFVVPAGTSAASLPILLATNTGSGVNKTFSVVLDGAGGVGSAPTFASQVTFVGTGLPQGLATADLNNDGKPDLLIYNNGTFTARLNVTAAGATTPSFSDNQPISGPGLALVLATADINGDGKLDIVGIFYANSDNNEVCTQLNQTDAGSGTLAFSAPTCTTLSDVTSALVLSDINGDGKADILVGIAGASATGNTVAVLVNTTTPGAATPSFASPQILTVGAGVYSVAVGDINGDGKPDVISTSVSGNSVSVLFNTTTPGASTISFAAAQAFAVRLQPGGVVTADIDNDGKPDLVVANSDETLSVLINTTTPGSSVASFATPQTLSADSPSYNLAAVDFNGDGKLDIVVSGVPGLNQVYLFENLTPPGASVPTFAPSQPLAVGTGPFDIVSADFNGDGKPDIAASNYYDDTVSVLLNTTPASAAVLDFFPQQTFATAQQASSIADADFNGDGKPDIVVGNSSEHTVSIYFNTTAPGAAAAAFTAQSTFGIAGEGFGIAAADINGDGRPDVITANDTSNTISVLANTTAPGASAPSFAAAQNFATGILPLELAVADFNGDGKPDIAVSNLTGNSVSVLLNTTDLTSGTPSFATQVPFAVGSGPSYIAAADINRDGRPDLIVTDQNSFEVSVLLNTTTPGASTPSFAAEFSIAFPDGRSPNGIAAVDVNGDGAPDLVVTDLEEFTVFINTTAPGAATPSFAAGQSTGISALATGLATADLDGDGKPDLVISEENTNTDQIWINTTPAGSSTVSFHFLGSVPAGNIPYGIAIADFNSDGRPDLSVVNGLSGNFSVMLNSQYNAAISGSPATGTIVHDYIFGNGFEIPAD